MNNLNIGNEEKLILYCSIYGDIDLAESIQENVDMDKVSGKRFLDVLRGNAYKDRNLIAYNLHKYQLYDTMSDEVKEYLDTKQKEAQSFYEEKIREIRYIEEKLSEIRQKFLVLKGFGISETVYKDLPYIRDFNDIDILVDENDADAVYDYLLSNMGYQCDKSPGERLVYKKFFQHYAPIHRNGITVEMHHRLTQKDDPYDIDTKRMLQDAQSLQVRDVCLLIPDQTDMLISLCYHLFQHEYRESRYMLRPYTDIFNYLCLHRDKFDWILFQQRVREEHLDFPIAYSLFYVNDLYEQLLRMDIVPGEVLTNIMPHDFNEKKEAIVSRHLFNNDAPIGYWEEPHMERIFMETKTLRQELCRKFFFYYSDKGWQEECRKLGIPFEENFKFSPRIWEKYGRI